MSDQNKEQPSINIQRIYLKDLSLKQPNSPAIFLENDTPSVDVQVNINVQKLADSVFENVLTGTIKVKVKDKVGLVVEGKRAGIFTFCHIPNGQIDRLMGINCPTILFPYLRADIADAVTRAGFAPIHLADLNFEALYEQRLAHLAAQQQSKSKANTQENHFTASTGNSMPSFSH